MKEQKNILIAGGSGFLGQALQDHFLNKGHRVQILSRNPKASNEVKWDGKTMGEWVLAVEWADVVINLAGKSVDCRYTKSNKEKILNSRIDSTTVLRKAIQHVETKPEVWINSSSATIYIHAEKEQMTEDEGVIGDDFSMNVCKEWETVFFSETLDITRRVAIRSSIVLGNEGGAFPKLKQLTKWGMGGTQGEGEQYMSWIHVSDFCRAVNFVIDHQEIVGPINITAPNPVRNKDFMKVMRSAIVRKWGMNQPKWLLEIGARLIGTETELLLKSRNVIPERLTECGFHFDYANSEDAIQGLIGNKKSNPLVREQKGIMVSQTSK